VAAVDAFVGEVRKKDMAVVPFRERLAVRERLG